MTQYDPNFKDRVERIESARRNRAARQYVLRPDGLMVSRQRHLRFSFPLRGLILAFVITIAVKAYLIWFLGLELYEAEVLELLSGTRLEQAAARILMPDQLSMWVVGVYDWIATLVSGGPAEA